MKFQKNQLRVKKDPRGELIIAEYGIDIPFETKRVYFLKNLIAEFDRGFHAHIEIQQLMYCLSGNVQVLLDD
jgi:dTDP-4-dehydrorhamnose 3,5-epimerase-like enzyme